MRSYVALLFLKLKSDSNSSHRLLKLWVNGLYFQFISVWLLPFQWLLSSLNISDYKRHQKFWQKQMPVVPSWGSNSGGCVLYKCVVLWSHFYMILCINQQFCHLTLFTKPVGCLIQFSVHLCCPLSSSSPPGNFFSSLEKCVWYSEKFWPLATAFSSASLKKRQMWRLRKYS